MGKILILGGSYSQIPVILAAKKLGHKVFTCDYLPENPGHKLADESFNVSTTNLEEVLELSKKMKIDAILAYASDPAAPTASYVSEKLQLPGNSFNSVMILSDKGLFRNFLKDNKFNCPGFRVVDSFDQLLEYTKGLNDQFYIKPVDSSGSKGVSLCSFSNDLIQSFNLALSFSRSKKVIIEAKIEKKGPQIHGEAFVNNGELIFILLGDQYFSNVNPNIPLSTTVPSLVHQDIMNVVISELTIILKKIGFKSGGLNVEVIRDINDKIYFLEIGARNGGNFMPELEELATGFNMAKANVLTAFNQIVELDFNLPTQNYYTQLILHAHKDGIFIDIDIPVVFKKFIKNSFLKINTGTYIKKYSSSQDVIGVLLFQFPNKIVTHNFINYIRSNPIVIIN